jgi:hypothetical protein
VTDNKVKRLRDALLDELINQFANGVTVRDREGEIVTLSVDSKIMTVASKVVKDFAHEIEDDGETAKKAEKLEQFLSRRKELRVPPTAPN